MSTRGNILEIGLTLFNEKGYQNVGVRDIARELKISPGNLSYHFPRKEIILAALLDQFANRSNTYFLEYNRQSPTNANLLVLLKQIFHWQFQYRGVKIGHQMQRYEGSSDSGSEYDRITKQRDDDFGKVLSQLAAVGQLVATEQDLEFMQAHLSLFGRFWLSESMLLRKYRDEDHAIAHYLKIFARLLELFSTEAGMSSIAAFKKEYLTE